MKKKKLAVFLAFVLFFFAWSVFLYYCSPAEIVNLIGIRNSYLILGIFAFLGGTSILLPFPYYLFTISFGAAGLNPFILGIAAGLGTLAGDTTSYYLAYHGREHAPKKFSKFAEKISKNLIKKRPNLVPLFAYLYASIAPLPDDLLMIPAGLMRYPFFRLAIGAGLGKITFNTMLAFSGFYGWSLFFS